MAKTPDNADVLRLPGIDNGLDDLPTSLAKRGFSVHRLLGEGGMGRVLEVFDPARGERLALKVARGTRGGFAWQRLHREASVTRSLCGVGVVNVHELVADAAERPWFLMDLLEGEPLGVLANRCISREARRGLLAKVVHAAQIVGRAHKLGVVHRDLKEANIVVAPDGAVTVLDWGLARVVKTAVDLGDVQSGECAFEEVIRSVGVEATREGARIGTPGSMSPEQAAGQDVDARADVWALGILSWQMLAGKPAYIGDRAPDVVASVLSGPPPMHPIAWAGPRVVQVVRQALSDVADRPSNGQAFADLLASALLEVPAAAVVSRVPWGVVTGLSIVGAAALSGLGMLAMWAQPLPDAPTAPAGLLHAPSVESLTRASLGAAHRQDHYNAAMYAVAAAEAGAPQVLRGMAMAPESQPSIDLRVPMPDCEIGGWLQPDGAAFACARRADLVVYNVADELSEAWTRQAIVQRGAFQGDGDFVSASWVASVTLAMDVRTGAPVRLSHTILPPLVSSHYSGSYLSLSPTRLRVNLHGEMARRDTRRSPCASVAGALMQDGSELHVCADGAVLLEPQGLSTVERWSWPMGFDLSAGVPMVRVSADQSALVVVSAQGDMLRVARNDPRVQVIARGLEPAVELAVSRTGRFVAVGSASAVRVWDLRNPREWTLPGPGRALAFDGDDRVVTWTGERLQRWALPEPPADVDWTTVAWQGDAMLTLETGGKLSRRDADDSVQHVMSDVVSVAVGAGRLVAGLRDGAIVPVGFDGALVQAIHPCERLLWVGSNRVACLPSGPGPVLVDVGRGWVDDGGAMLATDWGDATVAADGTLLVLDQAGGLWSLEPGGEGMLTRERDVPWISAVAISADAEQLALAGPTLVERVRRSDNTSLGALKTDAHALDVAYSPDGQWIAAVTASELRLFRSRDGSLAARRAVSTDGTCGLAWSEDAQRLALTCERQPGQVLAIDALRTPLSDVLQAARTRWGEDALSAAE